MKKIALVGTGGTIVSSGADATQLTGYSIKDLTVADILQAVPGLETVADIEVHQLCNIPSSCINEAVWLRLAHEVKALCRRQDVDGVVITHGTDTMEETAFFLHLVLGEEKPVVLTGAMRPATALSADGPINLYNAVRVAACDEARGQGVLISMNDAVLTARDATKTITTQVNTFEARNFGPIGWAVGPSVHFYEQSLRPHGTHSLFSLDDLKEKTLPRVDIIYAHAGDDGLLAQAAARLGAKGIVHAGTGHGTVSEKMEAALAELSARGVIVVRASRTGAGFTLNGLERWQQAGFIPSGSLNAQKARILLQLAIAKCGPTHVAIRKIFEAI